MPKPKNSSGDSFMRGVNNLSKKINTGNAARNTGIPASLASKAASAPDVGDIKVSDDVKRAIRDMEKNLNTKFPELDKMESKGMTEVNKLNRELKGMSNSVDRSIKGLGQKNGGFKNPFK